MTNDARRLADLMERAADEVRRLADDGVLVHTVTCTLDGRSNTNVSATIEADIDVNDCLESIDPVVIR